ncbi:MAG: aspartate aminotransferase family protein [Pikeienuella sp.]|uniref:aspartate aminotransferase family protein n=1 Tax=Pikeienuella sp. TaxID=2831957 RepID=UPI00391D9CB6
MTTETMATLPNSPEARDAAHHLHPYSNARKNEAEGPLVIARGEGVHVYDNAGRRYIEAMSGLWCVGVGFSEPRLVEAARKQMAELPYYHVFTQKSHGPVIDLAEKLVGMAPVPMSKVFFTNSGSEGNDTVVKLLWYRANAMGQPQRKKFIGRKRGYHGITIASGSLTGQPINHGSFDLPLPGFLHVTCPHHYRDALPGETEEAFSTRLAEELEALILAEGPDTIAAFIGEPVQGAGGVVVPPAGYWAKIQAVLRKYDILLVADEVICGFGRTGRMFGSETFGIEPDIMTLSKQLSSAYLPISAVLINERVYGPIADESSRIGVLGHGFTGGGHPVASAVALENLNIIEERGLVENARTVGAYMQARIRELSDLPLVGEVRGVGLIGAVELVTDRETKAPLGKPGVLGPLANGFLQERGVISRAMGDSLALCPPLIATERDIDDIVAGFRGAIQEAERAIRASAAA